jgi:ABC-type multidrug transport system fused ATPase/permease subunit
MLESLRALAEIFDRSARRRFLTLAGLLLVMAVFEAASVAAVLPFIQLALTPEAAESAAATRMAVALGASDTRPPVVVMGWLALSLFLLSSGLSAAVTWFMFRVAASENRRLSVRLLGGYMQQPYSFFLDRNTSELGKNVLFEADMLTNNVLVPLAQLVGRATMVVSVFAFLVYNDPVVALSAVGVVGVLYGGLYSVIRRPVARLSTRRNVANTDRFQASQEALGGIKDIKVLGREAYFEAAFRDAAEEFTSVVAKNQIIGSVPRYFLEAIGIGGILVLLLVFLQRGEAGAGVVSLLAVYAAAAYRVMPALQQIYTGVTNLRFSRELIALVRKELALVDAPEAAPVGPAAAGGRHADPGRVGFTRALSLDDVTFRYQGAGGPALAGLSFVVARNTSVGIVGETGSGKTTLVDVLLGLLQPQSGVIRLDDRPLEADQIRSWQNNVGYVPQHIYLSDSSIRHNIAFGVPEEEIDDAAVVRAAEMADVHRFVIEETQGQYDTLVGERGVRLSGGQRQRIGIARALYRTPEVLILDEATSSLDNRTEQAVMGAIKALAGRKTMIIVAHRLTTIQECDQILVIDKGRVREQGTYEELMRGQGAFAALARSGPV